MKECRFYNNGKCEYFDYSSPDLRTIQKLCCMRIVKPLTECFYYQPKIAKEVNNEKE